jgi:hypothetical protein
MVGHNRGMSVRARLLLFVCLPVAVIGVLIAAGVVWWRWDSARQPKVTDDIPVMNQAIADTLTAAGDQAAVAISGVYRAATCQLGPLRQGGVFNRSSDLYTDPGGEDALISRIAAGLPPAYQARRGTAVGGKAAPVTAAIGNGVQLSVRQFGPGWVITRARTGCTSGQPAAGAGDAAGGPAADTTNRLLSALGTKPAEEHQESIDCAAARLLVTLAVLSQPTDTADLGGRLRGKVPATARQFTSPSNRISYRDGPTSVIVSASDDNTAVTVRHTTSC